MAATMTKYGKVPMVNGKPVQRFSIEILDEDGKIVDDPMFFSAKWEAGSKAYTLRKNGETIQGFIWDEEKSDFLEATDALYEEGLKRAQRSANARGQHIKEITPAHFTTSQVTQLRNYAELIKSVSVAGKNETLDSDTVQTCIDHSVEFMIALVGEGQEASLKARINQALKRNHQEG